MSDLQAACNRLIAVVGERSDKNAPVTLGAHEWEAFLAVVAPKEPDPAQQNFFKPPRKPSQR